MPKPGLSLSNLLIFASFVITAQAYFDQSLFAYGMNRVFFEAGEYFRFSAQFILSQLIHAGFLHLLANSIILFIYGNQVEKLIGRMHYGLFFISNSIFVGLSILMLSSSNTVGISGFGMALMGFLFMALKKSGREEYKSMGIFILINVFAGLTGKISFVGHLAGAIYGMIWYFGSVSLMKGRK